jgi:hypothetical protein
MVWTNQKQGVRNGKLYVRTLEFRASEILQNLLPIRWVVETTQVGLQFSAEDLQCRALANSVCSDQAQDLTRTGHWQAMQLEAVGRVAMGDHGFEVCGKVYNGNGVEWTFLGADTATDAETLRDEGDLGFWSDFNAKLASADDWARLLALLSAFLYPSSVSCTPDLDLVGGWHGIPWACTAVMVWLILVEGSRNGKTLHGLYAKAKKDEPCQN